MHLEPASGRHSLSYRLCRKATEMTEMWGKKREGREEGEERVTDLCFLYLPYSREN